MKSILDLTENTQGDVIKADDAERQTIDAQKNDLKNNDYKKVLAYLKSNREADNIDEDKAPVRACYRYHKFE